MIRQLHVFEHAIDAIHAIYAFTLFPRGVFVALPLHADKSARLANGLGDRTAPSSLKELAALDPQLVAPQGDPTSDRELPDFSLIENLARKGTPDDVQFTRMDQHQDLASGDSQLVGDGMEAHPGEVDSDAAIVGQAQCFGLRVDRTTLEFRITHCRELAAVSPHTNRRRLHIAELCDLIGRDKIVGWVVELIEGDRHFRPLFLGAQITHCVLQYHSQRR